MNIAEILQRHAREHPDDIAIIDAHQGMSRETSYREFEQAAGQIVALFKQAGLRPGDTALVVHTMSTELYIAIAAILRLGLKAMFVDPSAGRRHIERCCHRLPPQALIAGTKAHWLRLTSAAIRRIPFKFSIDGRVPFARSMEQATRLTSDKSIHQGESETAALVTFTSGSTGFPKAAVRSHGFLLSQHRAIEEELSLVPGEFELATLPIFVLANLASRVTSIIANADLRNPAVIDPQPVISQIRCHAATRAAASPAFFEQLVDHCEQRNTRLPTLRKIFTGGGPVPLRLLDRLQRLAPQAEVTAVYGSTEAEPISTLRLEDVEDDDRLAMRSGQGLLAGRPVPSLAVRVMSDCWGRPFEPMNGTDFDALCCPIGQPGEIVVSGGHVLEKYLQGQGDEENKFRVDGTGWHRTGDAGYFDRRGRLWLLGRCEARIDGDEGPFYPLGVEQAALRHRGISRAAVVAHNGQRVLAVSLRDRLDPPDLSSLQQSLSIASVDSIQVLNEIPVDLRHNSKIDYPALHALLEK